MGLSVPLSGAGAPWGKGNEWVCKQAAKEIKDAGGIKIKDKTYNVECLAYDNKFTAADGAKVAQTLLNRDGVRFVCAAGSAPVLAAQSLTEREGALLFSQAWARSTKGPKFPLTFSVVSSPLEVVPGMVGYITKSYPEAKTVAMLNVTDATGRDMEQVARPAWERAGVKVLTSDFFERGTTEFQPAAQRLAALKPDIIDISSPAPADIGQIFKELAVLGWKGIKVSSNGTAAEGIVATGGAAADGIYLGAAVNYDGSLATEHQRKLNSEATTLVGESLSVASTGCYDAVYMLKAGAEKAQSVDPKMVAAALPNTTYRSFYGDNIGFGGQDVYGSVQQPMLPTYITQIVGGRIADRAKIDPKL